MSCLYQYYAPVVKIMQGQISLVVAQGLQEQVTKSYDETGRK